MPSQRNINISGKNGKDLEKLFIELVEQDEWKNRCTYSFYTSNSEEPCFKIESNSKPKQTGNGMVTDLKDIAWPWDKLENVLKETVNSTEDLQQGRKLTCQQEHLETTSSTADITHSMSKMSLDSSSSEPHYTFPKKRECFLKSSLSEFDFGTEAAIAIVLLLFEVARRRSDEDYPLNREQTKKAIKEVMSNNGSAYQNKVMIYILHKIHNIFLFHH